MFTLITGKRIELEETSHAVVFILHPIRNLSKLGFVLTIAVPKREHRPIEPPPSHHIDDADNNRVPSKAFENIKKYPNPNWVCEAHIGFSVRCVLAFKWKPVHPHLTGV